LKLADKHPGIGRTIHRVSDLKEIVNEINYTDHEIDGLAANDFRII
jgi:hypothetical protein